MFEHVAELLSPVTQQAGKWLGESWEEIPAFVAFFLACFLAALVFWSRVVRLPLEKASLLSSCTMSLVHALVVDIVGYQLLQDWKTFDLDMPNTPKQTRMLQFSLGYMIADFGYLMLFTPTDLLFIVHHTISSFYIVGCLKHGHSAISCILMFWMGEITSPLLNAFTFSRELRHVSKGAQKVFVLVSPLFTAVYILVRSIVAPPLVVWFVYSLWFRASAIPLAWRAPMGACVTLGIVGSQVWTAKLVKGFMRQRKKAKAV